MTFAREPDFLHETRTSLERACYNIGVENNFDLISNYRFSKVRVDTKPPFFLNGEPFLEAVNQCRFSKINITVFSGLWNVYLKKKVP